MAALLITYRALVFLVFSLMGFLCLTVLLIARLYEKKTGTRTWYQMFGVAILLSTVTMALYAFSEEIGPLNPVADAVDIVASLIFLVFGWLLYKKMTEVK